MKACSSCPFTHSEEAEQGMNWGCLPEPKYIIELAQEHDVSWGCHGSERICRGFAAACKHLGIDIPSPVISYEIWAQEGETPAINRAKGITNEL